MSKAIYDAEASVLLRAQGSAAVTATATDAAKAFDWEYAAGFALVVKVSDVETGVGDETYSFTVNALDPAGGNSTDIMTTGAITTAGEYIFALDGDTARLIDADAAQISLTATLGGNAPSITYSAFLNPAFGFAP